MTRLCASIMVDDKASASGLIAQAEEHGADMLELRVDSVADDPRLVADLLGATRLPCIVTCRHESEGGGFCGPEQVRIELFEHLCAAASPPTYIDVEWRRFEQHPDLQHALRETTAPSRPSGPGLILSMHDFDGRPAGLLRTVAAMASEDACQVIKVAHRARSLRDCLEHFDLLHSRGKPMIALGMGEFGVMTRVLAGKFGGLLTFAGLDPASVTAPGQLSLDELLETYRYRSIKSSTAAFGVVGYPVAHSLGPVIHNAGFGEIDFDGVYLPLPVAPGWEPFKATVLSLVEHEGLNLQGLSVTLPHKEHLLGLAEEHGWGVHETARLVGAANTLARDDRGWQVRNTDVTALQECLREALEGANLAGVEAAVIGAGGVGRAAAAALARLDAEVTVYNRTPARAEQVAEALRASAGTVRAAGLDALDNARPKLVVNATSVGMTGGPKPDDSPVPASLLRKGVIVLDTVYNPMETPLLRQAREAGCLTIDGLLMFIRQAAAQFRAWTGTDAPVEVMRERARRRLEAR
jgi:3-dehydroquinate dehydratase/shikimate dehydrogenase